MNTISLKPGFRLVAMCITVPVFAVALGCVATMRPTTAVAQGVPGSNDAGAVVNPGSVPPPVAAPVAGPAPPIFPRSPEAPAAGPPAADPRSSPAPALVQAGPHPGRAPAHKMSRSPPPVDATATEKSKAPVSPECKFCKGAMAAGPMAGPAPSGSIATPANKLPQVMTAPAAQPAAKLPAGAAKPPPNKARANDLKDVGKNIEQPTR